MMTNGERRDLEDRFRDLHRLYFHRVAGYLRNMGFLSDRAADLAQETFFRVYEAMTKRDVNSFESYLFQTAKRVALNEIRRDRTQMRDRPEVSLEDLPGIGSQAAERLSDRAPLPNEELETREEEERRRRLLREAMKRLPDSQRRCLLLRFGGLSYEEVASLLGITLDSVKSRLYEARKQLAADVQREQERERASMPGGGTK